MPVCGLNTVPLNLMISSGICNVIKTLIGVRTAQPVCRRATVSTARIRFFSSTRSSSLLPNKYRSFFPEGILVEHKFPADTLQGYERREEWYRHKSCAIHGEGLACGVLYASPTCVLHFSPISSSQIRAP